MTLLKDTPTTLSSHRAPDYHHQHQQHREMSSGVAVNQDCLTLYQELKLKKKYKYIIFGLSPDNTEIVKLKTAATSADYEDFVEELPENECRWAVFDLEFRNEEGSLRNKIVFIHWSPEGAKIKDKMVFASSRDALRRSLVGIAVEIQGTDFSEVALETVVDKAKRGN